jgi:GNAT superfamily N-acetyltransferase
VKTDANEPVSGVEVSITDCVAPDFEVVFPLLQQLWPNKTLDRDTLGNLFSDARSAGTRVLLCARLGDRVVGFGSMTLKTHLWHGGLIGWVDELVVDAGYRGHGIGRKLLERLMELAGENGCRAIELDSAFHREEAHSFYEGLGLEKRAYLFFKKLVTSE